MLTLSSEIELRRVCEQNALRVAAVNEYEVRFKDLKKKVNKKELNGMALPREVKWSKEAVYWLEYENKLPQQTTEGLLDSASRESGTSSSCSERLLELLEPQYVGPVISVPQSFGVWCGK